VDHQQGGYGVVQVGLTWTVAEIPILLVECVFNGDGVVTFVDFTTFLHFALALLWNMYKSRRGSWVGDKLRNVIL
jgi:hypothetical protein